MGFNFFKVKFIIIIISFFLSLNIANALVPAGRYGYTTILVGKKIYFVGGSFAKPFGSYPLSHEFLYLDVSVAFNTTDISSIPWTNLSSIAGTPAGESPSVALGGPNNALIFLFGGAMENNSYGFPLVYTFNTLDNIWTTPNMIGSIPPRRARAGAVSDSYGKMYVFSGQHFPATGAPASGLDAEMDIIDTIRLSYTLGSVSNAPSPRDGHSSLILSNGIILYMGGCCGPISLQDIYLYDTFANKWDKMVATGAIPGTRSHFTTVLNLKKNRIIIHGGVPPGNMFSATPDLAVLDISSQPYNWIPQSVSGTGPMQGIASHTANVVSTYMVVAFGFSFVTQEFNTQLYLLDISNDSEYKWVTSFDPKINTPGDITGNTSTPTDGNNKSTSAGGNNKSIPTGNAPSTETLLAIVFGALFFIALIILGYIGYRWYINRDVMPTQ